MRENSLIIKNVQDMKANLDEFVNGLMELKKLFNDNLKNIPISNIDELDKLFIKINPKLLTSNNISKYQFDFSKIYNNFIYNKTIQISIDFIVNYLVKYLNWSESDIILEKINGFTNSIYYFINKSNHIKTSVLVKWFYAPGDFNSKIILHIENDLDIELDIDIADIVYNKEDYNNYLEQVNKEFTRQYSQIKSEKPKSTKKEVK